MNCIWLILQSLKSPVGSHYRFRLLLQMTKIVLIQTSLSKEFTFLVNKNKREGSERNRLDIDASLSRIFAVKLDRPDKEGQLCYLYEPTGVLTIKAKSPNKAYHDAHSSKDRRFL